MRRCATGHSATHRAVINDGDIASCARQQIARRHSGNARTDDTNIDAQIFVERRRAKLLRAAFPKRNVVTYSFADQLHRN